MTKEELNKLKYVLLAFKKVYYVGWSDIDDFWDSYGEYTEFSDGIDDALDIIEKELNNKNND